MKLKLALIFFFILLMAQFTIAVPSLPLILNGNVTINNKEAPVGTIISAKIEGIPIEEFKLAEEGRYSFVVNDKDFGNKLVEFYVNGIKSPQTTLFKSGKVEAINLAVEKQGAFKSLVGYAAKETGRSSVFVGALIMMVILIAGLSAYFVFKK